MTGTTCYGSKWLTAVAISICVAACIGDDYIEDTVAERVRIVTYPDTLAVGDAFQVDAVYTNAIGVQEDVPLIWTSSNPNVASIDQEGLVMGLKEGTTEIRAELAENPSIQGSISLVVSDTTVTSGSDPRTGTLRSTSSYLLQGSFVLSQDNDLLTLSLGDDYAASSQLPGLYVYLSNNPNSINGAYEIGEVTRFEGAHAYTIPVSEAGLNQYSHVLYFCKPFNVKVGDGPFDN